MCTFVTIVGKMYAYTGRLRHWDYFFLHTHHGNFCTPGSKAVTHEHTESSLTLGESQEKLNLEITRGESVCLYFRLFISSA